MPLPLLFIGIAAASGMLGIGGAVKAGVDTNNAKQINKNANKLVQQSTDCLNAQRLACGNALTQLGAEKLSVLNGTLTAFLDVFTQIKNVDFGETEGLDELHRLHIDEQEFVELRGMANFAGSIAGGAVAGTASGALAAFGAYGAAQALAFACVLSIGDFGVVALFGNDDFRTLPFYLYQQIGSYRSQDGAVTALILLLLCFLLFTVIEKLPGRDVKTD